MPNFIMSYLGSTATPGEAGNQFWALIYVLIIFTGVSVAVMAMNWLERKALAHFQIRLGPMRVGPHGLLQPIADAIKLMLKEDIIPAEADQFVFWVAPLIGLLTAFAVYTVIPFGPSQAVSDMNIGILFMLGVSSLGVLGIVVAGWASNSHYPLIGALRSSAQMVSYEVAMGLVVVSAILMTSLNENGTGTLSMIGIVRAQEQQGIWFIFKFFPLGLIAFIIFALAMVAETNRAVCAFCTGPRGTSFFRFFPGLHFWAWRQLHLSEWSECRRILSSRFRRLGWRLSAGCSVLLPCSCL
jgi:NADH-quinone oxidoreductase subunit H